MKDLIARLRNHALPDPYDEREVMHAPLLREAADALEAQQAEIEALKAVASGDNVLLSEQAALLRQCRAALDSLLATKPALSAIEYQCGALRDSIGNLRATLYEYRPQGVFGTTDEARRK